ncbi:hypothetical protein [Actinopolyspora mortivallis]|uniref:hypothetical protein n=1 Tax=Actinopolyspora mortivallis TaxID=33906 RepID=UPI0012ECFCAF|nr:hypothetical protein [Actinopolyspora mortivallis]
MDDFDGAWFTIASLRVHHAHLMPATQILVLDNHPAREGAVSLRELASSVPNVYYVPVGAFRSTTVCGMAFRLAAAETVIVLDSHVLLPPGSPDAVLHYFRAHPESRDLVQGPVLGPGGDEVAATHCAEVWTGGAYSWWELDGRGVDPHGDPFPVPMQGLGAFACRRVAWPGLHPRLRGYSCNEWYVHEKFRRRGGHTLCLPGFRWHHRFPRPSGIPYSITWDDRIRNYLICWWELGLDTTVMLEHFREVLDSSYVRSVVDDVDEEFSSPCGHLDGVLFPQRHELVDDAEVRQESDRRKIPFWTIGPVEESDPETERILAYRRCLRFAYLYRWESLVVTEPGSCLSSALEAYTESGELGGPARLLHEVPPGQEHQGSCTVVHDSSGVVDLLNLLPRDSDQVRVWSAENGPFHSWLTRTLRTLAHRPSVEMSTASR